MRVTKRFTFEAAHQLPNVHPGHKCGRVHGHSYQALVTIDGPINPITGMVLDFSDLSELVTGEISILDHRTLNHIDGLDNPTAENLAVWIWDRIERPLHGLLVSVTVQETTNSWVEYEGPR